MWIFFWSKSYFCVHNFSFSALSEQECVQCALFLIWSLSDLSDQMWPGLHCTIALGRVQFLFTSYFPTKSENCTGCLCNGTPHTFYTPGHFLCIVQKSCLHDLTLETLCPQQENKRSFFFIFHFHSCLVGCMTINYALQVQIGVQLLLIDYGNN